MHICLVFSVWDDDDTYYSHKTDTLWLTTHAAFLLSLRLANISCMRNTMPAAHKVMPFGLCLSPIVHERPCAMKTCLCAIAPRPQLLCNPRLHIFRHALTLHTLHAFTHALTWSHITCIKTYTRMTAYYIKHTHTRTHTHIHVLASHAHALT